jgi:hypothetical protein
MADFFENIPSFDLASVAMTNGNMYLNLIQMGAAVSWNHIAVIVSGSFNITFPFSSTASQSYRLTGRNDISCSLGLYSLTGATLNLVNSCSKTLSISRTASATRAAGSATTITNCSTSYYSWLTLVTSATSNITDGNWFLGYFFSSSAAGTSSRTGAGVSASGAITAPATNAYYAGNATSISSDMYGGPFAAGSYPSGNTTNALPASIATSDAVKYEAPPNNCYVLISS